MIKIGACFISFIAILFCANAWLSSEEVIENNQLVVGEKLNDDAANKEKTISKSVINKWVHSKEPKTQEEKLFLASLPASLKDSPPPSSLDVDKNGDLIVNMKVRNLFEFYLSAMGEDTLEDCIARIRHNLQGQLNFSALNQATEILEGYIQYRNYIGEIKNDFMARYPQGSYQIATVKEMKSVARESRGLFLSDVAINAFYKKEDEYDEVMLERVAIKSNNSLSKEEKLSLLNSLEDNSPQWMLAQEKQATLISTVQKQEASIRENGGTIEDVQALRIESYGEEGAANLHELDLARAKWNERVEAYRNEAAPALNSNSYSKQEQQQILNDLRQQYFSGSELIRIQSLDKTYARNYALKG
ncbi:MAG: lipase secretion chaperone [Bermanella sp.]